MRMGPRVVRPGAVRTRGTKSLLLGALDEQLGDNPEGGDANGGESELELGETHRWDGDEKDHEAVCGQEE